MALSIGLRRPSVRRHLALRSPDFPHTVGVQVETQCARRDTPFSVQCTMLAGNFLVRVVIRRLRKTPLEGL